MRRGNLALAEMSLLLSAGLTPGTGCDTWNFEVQGIQTLVAQCIRRKGHHIMCFCKQAGSLTEQWALRVMVGEKDCLVGVTRSGLLYLERKTVVGRGRASAPDVHCSILAPSTKLWSRLILNKSQDRLKKAGFPDDCLF